MGNEITYILNLLYSLERMPGVALRLEISRILPTPKVVLIDCRAQEV